MIQNPNGIFQHKGATYKNTKIDVNINIKNEVIIKYEKINLNNMIFNFNDLILHLLIRIMKIIKFRFCLILIFHKFYINSYLNHTLWKPNVSIMCKKR